MPNKPAITSRAANQAFDNPSRQNSPSPTQQTESLRDKLMAARDLLYQANQLYVDTMTTQNNGKEFLSVYPCEVADKVHGLLNEIEPMKSALAVFIERNNIHA